MTTPPPNPHYPAVAPTLLPERKEPVWFVNRTLQVREVLQNNMSLRGQTVAVVGWVVRGEWFYGLADLENQGKVVEFTDIRLDLSKMNGKLVKVFAKVSWYRSSVGIGPLLELLGVEEISVVVVRVLVNQTAGLPVVFVSFLSGDSAEFAAFDLEVDRVHYVDPLVSSAFLLGHGLHGAHPQYSPLGRVEFKHYYPTVAVGGVS
jgi:hypothetical protein